MRCWFAPVCMRQMAAQQFARERKDHLLQPTALVSELYLRLEKGVDIDWKDRAHFFAVSATIMRRILVDYARKKRASKRDSDGYDLILGDAESSIELLQLHEAINGLTRLDPQQAQIVELKFFGGLTGDEIGEILGLSKSSVSREWWLAKQWLKMELA